MDKTSHVIILIIALTASSYALEGDWFKLMPIIGIVGISVYYLHKVLK